MRINCSLHNEGQNEHNLIYLFRLTDSLFYWRLGRLPMHAFLFYGWIKVMHPITSGSSAVFFLATHDKSQHDCFSVLESGKVEPGKLQLSTFSNSYAESYEQMILKYPELDQVVEQWCGNLLELQLRLYSSSLCKCSMVMQHREAMQWFLCLRRRTYVNERLSNLQAILHQCIHLASTS